MGYISVLYYLLTLLTDTCSKAELIFVVVDVQVNCFDSIS